MNKKIKHCFSIDVEGSIEEGSFGGQYDNHFNVKSINYEIEKNLDCILEFLNDHKINATFFFLGRVGDSLPHLVLKTANMNHEIACHSYHHKPIYLYDRKSLHEILSRAKKTLEDASGYEVIGFRAPVFSVLKKNYWSLDIIKEVGFKYDSSIYPISFHDKYGIPNAKTEIFIFKNGLVEFPLSTFQIFGIKLPFGGGGYLRLFPNIFTKYLFRCEHNKRCSRIIYIHPYEFGNSIHKIEEFSYLKSFRRYYKCGKIKAILDILVNEYDFTTAKDIINDKINLGAVA